jgi:hypothetical protein
MARGQYCRFRPTTLGVRGDSDRVLWPRSGSGFRRRRPSRDRDQTAPAAQPRDPAEDLVGDTKEATGEPVAEQVAEVGRHVDGRSGVEGEIGLLGPSMQVPRSDLRLRAGGSRPGWSFVSRCRGLLSLPMQACLSSHSEGTASRLGCPLRPASPLYAGRRGRAVHAAPPHFAVGTTLRRGSLRVTTTRRTHSRPTAGR